MTGAVRTVKVFADGRRKIAAFCFPGDIFGLEDGNEHSFVDLGLEHSIANMGTFSMAMLGGGSLTLAEALHNLLYSTIGNVIGGVLLVGLPFRYLNPREREEQMRETLLNARPDLLGGILLPDALPAAAPRLQPGVPRRHRTITRLM